MSTQTSQKPKTAVLLVSSDLIGPKMAGPGIRYYELARILHPHTRLTLAAPAGSILPPGAPQDLLLETYAAGERGERKLYTLARASGVIIIQGNLLYDFSRLKTLTQCMVVDLYDPFVLENIQYRRYKEMDERQYYNQLETDIVNEQLALGDFFICGSEKQRDYWLGALSAVGRVNPYTNDVDPSFRKLIDLTPFGLSQTPPQHQRPVLKGVHPGIAADDKVLIWGGGIWEWFDALTLIRAMAGVVKQRTDVKLYFMGVKHPNPVIPPMKACQDTIDLARELNLLDRYVFFNDWTPYEERQNYLMEADLGVSLHLDHIETRFSLRTRIFDYIWASLPIITTKGDSMSELVSQYQLGYVVDEGDVAQVTRIILKLLDQPNLKLSYKAIFEQVQPAMAWQKVVQPLINYCVQPYHAADYATGTRSNQVNEASLTLQDKQAKLNQAAKSPDRASQWQALSNLEQLKKAEDKFLEAAKYAKEVETAYTEKVRQLEEVNFLYQEAVTQRHRLESTLSNTLSVVKVLLIRLTSRVRWPKKV